MHDDAVVLGWLVGSIDFEALLALRPDLDRVSLEEMKAQVLAGQLEPTTGESLVLRVGAVVNDPPGPAGIGVVLETSDFTIRAAIAEETEDSSIHEAEARAVLRGLIEARRYSPGHLSIRSDSELLVRQLAGAVEIHHPQLREIHARIGNELGSMKAWEARAVPREENARADALARIALQKPS